MKTFLLATFAVVLAALPVQAEIRTSAVFGDSMVLQREKPIHVWGWADAGSEVKVTLAGNTETATSDADGRFDVKLPTMEAGGPHELSIQSGGETQTFKDVLIGEVWLCSGQSNMQWALGQANDADLESLAANNPNIRLITVPQVGTQELQTSFDGHWEACTPESVKQFSAVGYFFGRQLQATLGVPVGLIDNSWGGSSAEAWVRRDVLQSAGTFDDLLARWRETESSYDHDAAVAKYKEQLKKWQETKQGNQPRAPRNPLTNQHRPANLYNGVLNPVIGYSLRGVIWYQGESNAGRAYQYRDLFPLMIQNWRDEWDQEKLPFYWVQLADYMAESAEPADSAWAELREAQTMTMSKLPDTGEAVILNLGEASDIHPKNKQDVGKRLARWALAKDYGYDIPHRSPTYKSMSVKDGKIVLEFDHIGGGLDTFDVREPLGFTIAAADKKFVPAQAKITGKNTIEVSAESISQPVAARYAWANNPVCNVQSSEGLPLTPFRTDDWPGITANVTK
ncbi:sialate O-acetylesterase [Stieleria sp. TO1_6]|uniref:sialate O-acetylesterase n=1 Tax=Stieleria tagensis TaxID=2956795 RepID=UPI00209B3C1A|nr:sialate O-acetylesterase [Stieleria tagensis]MCO8120391.1 sialate O-acetylesterase [Stieleria tagensis]